MATRDEIATVFERHVQRFGYAKTTLDEVAAELHISKKTIYTHFEGKADIYAYLVGRMAEVERRRMAASVADLPTYGEKVHSVLRQVLTLSRAHITETTEEDWMQEYAIAGEAFTKATGDVLLELIEGGMGAGEFPRGDVVLVERMVAAMVVEYVLMVRVDPAYDRDDELVARIARFVG